MMEKNVVDMEFAVEENAFANLNLEGFIVK